MKRFNTGYSPTKGAEAVTDSEFTEAVRRNIGTVIRLAVTYLKDHAEAEDAAQEVFLKLFTSDKTFDSPEGEKAWLIRVTINHCINLRRSAWFSRRTELGGDICDNMEEDESDVYEAVTALPEKYRTLIHLYYYEGYSINEISKLTGVKPSTLATRLQRAREKLRKTLEKGE